MSEIPSGLVASTGWNVIHLFYRIDRARWRAMPESARQAGIEEFRHWCSSTAQEEGMQLLVFAGVTKFDLAVMAVHPDLWRVQQITQEIAASTLGTCLVPTYEFLSLTEASEYITNESDWTRLLIEEQKLDPASPDFAARLAQLRKRTAIYAGSRLHPQLPGNYPIFCFYPMSKARGEKNNWYRLDFTTRKKLMLEHGNSARQFASRVTQLITTCTGIDDWEWGVTLFSKDINAIRDIVYELRYDEASAVYGLFGSFYIGIRFEPEHLQTTLRL